MREILLHRAAPGVLFSVVVTLCFPPAPAGAVADGPMCLESAARTQCLAPELRFREPSPLDTVPRVRPSSKRLHCDMSDLVLYRSRLLRYVVRAHPSFAKRLQRFDRVVVRLARERYGRAPWRLAHSGVFSCRSERGRAERFSEHALGNAIDVTGFDFGRMPRAAAAPKGMPTALRHGFRVRVADDWSASRSIARYHGRFLHALMDELRERPEIFRGIVGPPHRRHDNHLHLDAAPSRYALFSYDP